MKTSTLLAFTTAALLATGSAFACPKKEKSPSSPGQEEGVYEVLAPKKDAQKPCPKKDGAGSVEESYEVADKPEGERPQRPEGERPKRPEGERPGPGGPGPEGMLRGLDLSDEQKEQVKTIFEASRKAAEAVRAEAKAAAEAGEEVNREEVMKKMRAIHEGAMKQVYDEVLNAEQKAKLDNLREEREKREAERKKNGGEEGDRPRRRPGGEGAGEGPRKGGDDLDL